MSNKEKPEKKYIFDVCFSLHCFTYKIKDDSETTLFYKDSRETRVFCFERYELSKKLPQIIQDIFERNCYHTGHSNYFVAELLDMKGKKIEYQVYFSISKSTEKKGRLTLYVQSAYPNTKNPSVKKKKPIRFRVLAHNVLMGKKIKPPA
jgi:hypothetical protein